MIGTAVDIQVSVLASGSVGLGPMESDSVLFTKALFPTTVQLAAIY